jgi:hypothetical protein
MKRKRSKPPRHKPEISFISEQPHPEWQEKRWRKEKIHELPQGISLVPSGKAATLYVRSGERVIDIYAELAGNPAFDVVIFLPSNGLQWIDVNTFQLNPLSPEESARELRKVQDWLAAKHIRYSI